MSLFPLINVHVQVLHMTRTVITLLSSYDWRQKKDNCAFYSGVASVSTHTSHLTTITTDH